ncbi:hypothetical protein [Arabiibacter massiliensis]|uniref:hypothetical protein n=1 Tax=Arabiibacter massiliensis TaxID=1870985 RepID=UPI00117B9F12|nr:hypothetical protein [Arabiibacter massiliensis]
MKKTRVLFTYGFERDVAMKVQRASKRREVIEAARLIADMPVLGSTNLPASIVEKYGEGVRKAVVSPFLLIYELKGDEARMIGLMHEREAY